MGQALIGCQADHEHHHGGAGGQHEGEAAGVFLPLLGEGTGQTQGTHLPEHVLLHAFGEYKMGKAGIQGVDYAVIHRSDTILSVQIPGACAPGGGG